MEHVKIKYPDGQISAEITLTGQHGVPDSRVTTRINSYEDLIYVRSIAEARQEPYTIDLFIPCLFGQRSDRRFKPNQSFDLKVIAEIINNGKFRRVDILDPHSDVALSLIDRSVRVGPEEYVKETLYDIDKAFLSHDADKLTLVAPDAGAYKKVFHMAQEFDTSLVAAVKHRFEGGQLHLEVIGNVKGKDCLIVDDLADGGRTFVDLAKALKELGARDVFLYVSHGYFNKGFDELKKYIRHIYCTNSVKDINDPYVTQFKVI